MRQKTDVWKQHKPCTQKNKTNMETEHPKGTSSRKRPNSSKKRMHPMHPKRKDTKSGVRNLNNIRAENTIKLSSYTLTVNVQL